MEPEIAKPRVGLFATCLVDLIRPQTGFAAARLLEEAGCTVVVPPGQTCCGQPAFSAGDREGARQLAENVIAAFAGLDYVVAPSGSCAAMIRRHYPALFADDPDLRLRARALAERTYELTAFLTEVRRPGVAARFAGTVTYHDSCSGLRELGIKAQPRALLAAVEGLTLAEMATPEECCGFGGSFCVAHPGISAKMAADKAADVAASGAKTLLGGDLGCLINIAEALTCQGAAVEVRHVAEVLAGMADGPAIGRTIGRAPGRAIGRKGG